MLRTLKFNPCYFLCFELSDVFKNINKNHLKNLFFKDKHFAFLWSEVDKMLLSGFIGFSKEYFYRNKVVINILVEFLLEVFLSSLDFFFLSLEKKYTSKKYVFNTTRSDKQKIFLQSVKIDRFLKNSLSLKNFSFKNFDLIESPLSKKFYVKPLVFERRLNFFRHKYQILFFVLGSKKFSFFLKSKILLFLRSHLQITTKFMDLFNGRSENIFFLGFNIRFSFKTDNLAVGLLKSNKKYLSKILFKLDSFKKEIARFTINRIYSELFDLVNKSFLDHKLKKFFGKKIFIWSYFFQLEAIRSTQFNRLLLTRDQKFLISNELVSSYLVGTHNTTAKYFFSLYSNKLQFVLLQLLHKLNPFLKDSFFCLDLGLNFLFIELRKKIFLLYNNFYKTVNFKNADKILVNKKELNLMKLSSFYNVSFSEFDLFYLQNINFNKKFLRSHLKLKQLEVFLSFDFCVTKLRVLGFMHPFKNRSISNSKYLTLDDIVIVKIFGFVAFNFLNWFRCVSNISDLKRVVELLRQSCFLTLCRKHNKHKTWAFDIYTIDLLVIENLCFQNINFPKKYFLEGLKRKFFIYQSQLRLDEKFFL